MKTLILITLISSILFNPCEKLKIDSDKYIYPIDSTWYVRKKPKQIEVQILTYFDFFDTLKVYKKDKLIKEMLITSIHEYSTDGESFIVKNKGELTFYRTSSKTCYTLNLDDDELKKHPVLLLYFFGNGMFGGYSNRILMLE